MTAKRQSNSNVSSGEQETSSRIPAVLISILFFGVALLLGYIALAVPEEGTAMESVQLVLSGLGGHLSIVFALIMAWLGLLSAFSASGKKVSVLNACLDGVLFLCLFTGVQLFFAEKVIQNRMTILTFANFVNKSYGYHAGGGAIGAIFAWPLYQVLGKWGGLLAVILVAVLSLAASGKLGKFFHWAGKRSEEIQYSTQQHRMEKDNERMFKVQEESRRSMFIPNRSSNDEASREVEEQEEEQPQRRADADRETVHSNRIDEDRTRETRDRTMRQTSRESGREDAQRRTTRASQEGESAQGRSENNRFEDTPRNAQAARSKGKSSNNEDSLEVSNHSWNSADAGPTMAAFDGSKRRKRDRVQSQPDRPEFLRKESKSEPKPDLTIEPDESDVLENDKPEPKAKIQKMKRVHTPEPEDEDGYNYPPIDLLENGERIQENYGDSDMEKARLLEETLKEFGISTKLTGIAHGPAVTRFELQPAPGVKVSRITNLADDIAMHLAAMSVRIEAPIPGKAAVGVEIPNDKVEVVRLRDVLESPEARKSTSRIAVGLGKDNSGRYIVADIAKMPHVLIAGQTGSGKSVCINSIITSILFRATPEEVKLILIDPKVVELSIYNGIPHLVCPVVTDCKKASSALQWAVSEMTMRYKKFAERGVRDIKGYNKALKADEKPMPQMVIIIDELADLMMVAPGEVEDSICRLAQLARAAGMHLVIATQRPSVNVITGIIKANIPTRIAFSVASQVDSRTMIDHGGAEKLLGNGDMLFVPSGINKPMRVQGAWVSDEEVHAVTQYIKERSETAYDADMIEQMDNAIRTDVEKEEAAAEYDAKLPEAVEIVVEAGQASVSMLQRRMRIGYARAGRLIDEMERRGIVSEADGSKPRSVLITREQMNDLFEDE